MNRKKWDVPEPNHYVKDRSGQAIPCTLHKGKLHPPFHTANLDDVAGLRVRGDDVFLCGYPKSGCHWVYEMTQMLLHGKAEVSEGKGASMLGLTSSKCLDALPSPRIFNCHSLYSELPQQCLDKGSKIILTVRNPKDTIVSYHKHHLTLFKRFNYDGSLEDFFQLFVEGQVHYGSYFDYLLSWDEVVKNESKRNPVHVMAFEDMKADPERHVMELAEFLGVEISADFAKAVAEKCSFNNLKDKPVQGFMLRKGQVGDWKNWLTSEQSDAIDRLWKEKMADCTYQPKQ